ncbi:N-acetylmuramoyl-L-alanine amidase, partial [Methylophilus sp.]
MPVSRFKQLHLWLITLLFALSMPAQAAEVILANLQQQGNQVHLELLLDQQIKYRVFTLDNPFRVVIDMDTVAISPTLKALPPQLDAQHPYLSKIRIAPFTENTTRLVFDIKSDIKPLVTDMNAGNSQQRLAISIAPATATTEPPLGSPALAHSKKLQEAEAASAEEKPATASEPVTEPVIANPATEKPAEKPVAEKAPEKPVEKPLKQARPGQKIITIAVDAGHGGEDPGARGSKGSHEKHITLAIARKLKQQIDAEENMQAILIRDGDYFVPLG